MNCDPVIKHESKKRKADRLPEAVSMAEGSSLEGTAAPDATACNQKITVVLVHTELMLNRRTRQTATKLLHADSTFISPRAAEISLPRPDITHQSLMMLLDSPLNKAGLLNILLENSDGKIIQVNSEFRVPRTWKVFAKVIADFLSSPEGQITAMDLKTPLLKLLEPPLSNHIKEESSLIVSFSTVGRVVSMRNVASRLISEAKSNSKILVFMVHLNSEKKSEKTMNVRCTHHLSLSSYPIAASVSKRLGLISKDSVICNRLCNEVERVMEV